MAPPFPFALPVSLSPENFRGSWPGSCWRINGLRPAIAAQNFLAAETVPFKPVFRLRHHGFARGGAVQSMIETDTGPR